MDNQLVEKMYKISRLILAIMTFIIFNIMFINEDISWKFLPIVFALIAFGVSFPSSILSKKLVNIGDKIENRLLRILYYIIILPIIIFAFFLAIYAFVIFIYVTIPKPSEFSAALGQAFFALFVATVGAICIIVPYIQTLIVLILRRFIKK